MQISSDGWLREGITTKGQFTKLRTKLCTLEFLVFREENKRYFVGKRLRPFVAMLEKSRTASMLDIHNLQMSKADKSELQKVATDVSLLTQRVSRIEIILSELKSLQAPPPSAAAQKRSAELTEQLSHLLLQPH